MVIHVMYYASIFHVFSTMSLYVQRICLNRLGVYNFATKKVGPELIFVKEVMGPL